MHLIASLPRARWYVVGRRKSPAVFHKADHDVEQLLRALAERNLWLFAFGNIRLSHLSDGYGGIVLYQYQAPGLIASLPDQAGLSQITKVEIDRAGRGETGTNTDVPHRGGIAEFGYVPPQELVDLLLGLQTFRRLSNAVLCFTS